MLNAVKNTRRSRLSVCVVKHYLVEKLHRAHPYAKVQLIAECLCSSCYIEKKWSHHTFATRGAPNANFLGMQQCCSKNVRVHQTPNTIVLHIFM